MVCENRAINDPNFIRRSIEPREVPLQIAECTAQEQDNARCGDNPYQYKCTLRLPSDQDKTYQIESVKIDFMNPQFTGTELCKAMGSLRTVYQYFKAPETSEPTVVLGADILRLMSISYTSSNSPHNHYLLKPRYMIFYGMSDDLDLGVGDTFVNANGLYLEEFKATDEIYVYFGSQCQMLFPKNSVQAVLRGYEL